MMNPFLQTDLPFESNDITIGKVMAGMVALVIYFVPTLISRDKIGWKYIFICNLLTGWTFFGWCIAFVWALKAKSKVVESSKQKVKKKKTSLS